MHRIAPALLFTGLALLARAWIAEPSAPPLRIPAVASASPANLSPELDDVNAQVDRLHARTAAPPVYPAPSRDPFRFGRRVPVTTPAREAATPPPAIEAPAPVLPRLIAIVADPVDGVLVRRAVLSDGEGVTVTAVGETVGAFVLRAIGDDGVDLQQRASSAIYHLSLR